MATKRTTAPSTDNIIDSTQPGFTSTYENPRQKDEGGKDNSPKDYNPQKLFEQARKDLKTPITKKEEMDAANLVKSMLKKRVVGLKSQYMNDTTMMFFRYNAKDKNRPYDRTPMVLTLGAEGGSHMLALNLHWCPVKLRVAFCNMILNMYSSQINSKKPLRVRYKQVKHIINSMKLKPIIRLYIVKRMSSRGVIIPPEMWLTAVKLRAETFTGGYTSEALYMKALKGQI